jgi:hypothetical protein
MAERRWHWRLWGTEDPRWGSRKFQVKRTKGSEEGQTQDQLEWNTDYQIKEC